MKKRPTLYRRINGPRHRGRRRDPFYDSARWRKIRIEALMSQPICADPFGEHAKYGEVTPAVEVDHIVSRRVAPERELELENLQGLCHRCHSKKTAKEDQ